MFNNLRELILSMPTEETCREYLVQQRWGGKAKKMFIKIVNGIYTMKNILQLCIHSRENSPLEFVRTWFLLDCLFFAYTLLMHLLYADESGSKIDPKQIFFVLAGVSIFERQGFWISRELDKIAEEFNPSDPNSVELHGSPMYHGRRFWRNFPKQQRWEAKKQPPRLC